jgi:hypothetical protein
MRQTWPADRRGRRAFLAAIVVALVAVGTAAAVTHRAAVAPSNNSLPTISGSATAGSTLTANPGTWSGSAPISFQYQWRICDGNGGSCHDIAGATSQTYQLKGSDAGNTLRVQVIGSNGDGSSPATSVPTSRVASAGTGPANTAAPTITGTASTGSTLTVHNGSWSGSQPITFTYQWTVCDGNGNNCHDISGATSSTYVVKGDDAGNTIRVRVTAKNASGSTAATTSPTARLAVGSGGGGGSSACPAPSSGASVPATSLSMPIRLQVAGFQVTSGRLTKASNSFSARFQVKDTCGRMVSGALVFPSAVPFNQFSAREAATDGNGYVTLTFNRQAAFPASPKQQLLTMFVRARKPGGDLLAGISTRRLISFRIAR